ncbi:hypothetical protein [Catenulispora pinisilvae]|uniref:hypothetical protein n=1 Tax=Catenulispora pinisilvae TaxID=2705253 RepID=UPI0018920B07|nr:hypothetical protein [Catenulispora pinisilvae]
MADIHGLRATLAFIRANPQLWDQGSWLHCFAAIAVELAGYDVLPSLWVRLDDRSMQVWDAAAKVLNLTGNEARLLFAPGNTLAELTALIGEIGEIVRPYKSPRHARHLRPVG